MQTPKEILLDLLVFFVTIVVLAVWLIVLSPLYICRLIVKLLAKWLKSKTFGDMVPPLELFFYAVIETHFDQSPEAIPCLMLTVDGHLDFDVFKYNVTKKVLAAQGKSRNLIYDRLQQHIRVWLGFAFFEWDKNFDISDHVRLIQNQDITKATKCNIVMNLARKPFNPESSPWELLVFPYAETGHLKTLIVIRAHHIIGDGRSILKILTRLNGIEESKLFTNVSSIMNTKVSIAEKLKRLYQFNIAMPRVFFRELPKLTQPTGIFHESSTEDCEQVFVSETCKYPLELFKTLKRDMGVPFTVVLATALAKSLGYLNTLKVKGQQIKMEDSTQEFHGCMPIPRPEHPNEKLTNHFYLTKLSFISGDEPTGFERLMKNKENLAQAGRSILQFAVAQNIFINIICSLPVFICRRFTAETRRAFLISNMPGPTEELELWKHLISDVMFWIPDVRNNGVSFSVVSYNGLVRIGVCIDKCLAGEESTLETMIQIIQNELNEIFSLVKV